MPEIKHVFNQGKMNKDLDERIVENGQYRDAMNIQVSTSEGSEVGTVQNILGNTNVFPINQIAPNSTCVATIADEKNNCFYWFVYHTTKNIILRYKAGQVVFVFVDTMNVLNFNGNLITGVNIIDDFLLWTDNSSEPKKIHIQRCIDGTDISGFYHTNLIVPKRNITNSNCIKVREEHITVIKKSPKSKLVLDPIFEEKTTATATFDFDEDNDDELMKNGETGEITFNNISPNDSFYSVGDIVLLYDASNKNELPELFQVRIKITEVTNTVSLNSINTVSLYKFKILSIAPGTSKSSILYNCEKESAELIFSRKFVRFGYRYKFNDGEYSSFSPFTDVLFKPGDFEYNSKEAYNKAMENNLISLKLRNFLNKETPEDVVQVDILYKESTSPAVYIVDKIKYTDTKTIIVNNKDSNYWLANMYEIKSDLIYAITPSNQLLRLWDNVPRKALAQEVTGNRVVYANYVQNYDVDIKPVLRGDYISRYKNNTAFVNYYFENSTSIPLPTSQQVDLGFGQKSLKSLRNYQLGMTYLDEYNRETPIFTSVESRFVVPKKHARFKTKIEGKITTPPPSWAKSFKVYVKETATEYYNLAMSRVYRAEDNNLWLSFPSSERNKVDEETFLILKKAVDSDSLVPGDIKYKVLAIENEAPEYIRKEQTTVAEILCGTATATNNANDVFGINGPTAQSRTFQISVNEWQNTNVNALNEFTEPLSITFKNSINEYTSTYEIKSVTLNSSYYDIALSDVFQTKDAELLYPDYPTTTSSGDLNIDEKMKLIVYEDKELVNQAEFKGMFFVKINSNEQSEKYIIKLSQKEEDYEITSTLPSHYFSDAAAPGVPATEATTTSSNQSNGGTSVGRTNQKAEWIGLLDFGGSVNNSLFPTGHDFSGDQIGGFFIDKTFYIGTHGDSEDGVDNIMLAEHDSFIYSNIPKFGKGVYSENGKHYVEISFSEIGETACTGSFEKNDGTFNFADFNEPYIWQPGNNSAASTNYAKDYSTSVGELKNIISKLTTKNQMFKIRSDDNNIKYTILDVEKIRRYNFMHPFDVIDGFNRLSNSNSNTTEKARRWSDFGKPFNRRITYRVELDKSLTETIINNEELLHNDNIGSSRSVSFQFLEQRYSESTKIKVSNNPAIWETEPKETIDLDIYHEASEIIPLVIDEKTNERFIPKGSVVSCLARPKTMANTITYVTSWDSNRITFNQPIDLGKYQPANKPPVKLIFTRPDDSYTTIRIDVPATYAQTSLPLNTYIVKTNVSSNPFALSWYNCFSFNNGVESNRIRDDFNQPIIDKGAKVSTVLEENYEEERRSSGLIYSGIYNTNSGVNNLNQFIAAEKITKDLNPTYGSIQKLFSRNTDLISFCEDRVIRISANKDAIFNADGNPQLVTSNNVLGQTLPFSGDYGISKNPESFAAESYRVYFTDKQRGTVLRLSKDGLTPISEYGMSDYFKDTLKFANKIIGSYDNRKNEYNVTIPFTETTVSFKENIRGWSSFKSFVPEQALSMANDYYTIKNSLPYKHHVEEDVNRFPVDRNTFYGIYTPSHVDVLLNDEPSVIKSYKTLNYEGSQSNVNVDVSGAETGYYNLKNKDGWLVSSIDTDKQSGNVPEFIEKEGKWFNYIKGKNVDINIDLKTDEFAFQGIGRVVEVDTDDSIYIAPPITYGCTDPLATNYYAGASADDGSCVYVQEDLVGGCMDPDANNFNIDATYDNGSCEIACGIVPGCTDSTALNYDPLATIDDGSCVIPVHGCTDPRADNYDANANVDDGSCILDVTLDPVYSLTIKDSNDPDTNVIPPPNF
mgnify:CR=1 FL=1